MPQTLIYNGTLIDGNGGKPLPDAAVLIDGDRITTVATGNTLPRHDSDITRIDAHKGYILPGLIDAHVHISMEVEDQRKMMATPFSLNFYKTIRYMRNTLDAGITSVRDAGGADLGMKQAVEQGYIVGPRMQISINALTITGGHGDGWLPSGNELKLWSAHPGLPSGLCDGVEAVRKKAREMLRAGAEVLKVHATGGVLSPTDHPEFTQFSPAELEAIVQEGKYRRGIKVMAHAQGSEGIKNAVRAGIHSIEHGIYLDDECLELMIKNGTFLVPTLLAPVAVTEVVGMPEWGIKKALEVIEIHRDSIARAYKAGVKIAMGTDAGVMPHGTNLRELGLMMDCGMTAMETLVATTKTAAECMGWEDRVGTLEAGKYADVVIARTNPLDNVRSLENRDNIALVMKGGQVVKDIRKQ
jgi:imidazolonepropionase-like amidohydrolase